jgi:hypothetical protein
MLNSATRPPGRQSNPSASNQSRPLQFTNAGRERKARVLICACTGPRRAQNLRGPPGFQAHSTAPAAVPSSPQPPRRHRPRRRQDASSCSFRARCRSSTPPGDSGVRKVRSTHARDRSLGLHSPAPLSPGFDFCRDLVAFF